MSQTSNSASNLISDDEFIPNDQSDDDTQFEYIKSEMDREYQLTDLFYELQDTFIYHNVDVFQERYSLFHWLEQFDIDFFPESST